MFFVPLTQIESVELVVHSLRAAAGEADCSICPVRKVCMQQCLTIADSIGRMLETGALPQLGGEPEVSVVEKTPPDDDPQPSGDAPNRGGLRVVK